MKNKYIASAFFLIMIALNYLGAAGKINGMTQKNVSDLFAGIMAPHPMTFIIWGLIYFFLLLFLVYQFLPSVSVLNKEKIEEINPFFMVSCLCNIGWIFSWHYINLALSMFFMVLLFLSLIVINEKINNDAVLSTLNIPVKRPFSVYLSWIGFALFANLAAFFNFANYSFYENNTESITVVILFAAALVGIIIFFRYRSFASLITSLWAFDGLLYAHILPSYYNRQYPSVVYASLSLILLLVVIAGVFALKVVIKKRRAS